MHKWIAGSACAAAVLSLAVASAQTYPQTPDKQPTTKSPSTTSGDQGDTSRRGTTGTTSSTPSARTPAQQVTVTGCLMRGTDTKAESWILSNATASNAASASGRVSENSGAVNESTAGTSRSGSPSNEGTSAANRGEKATTGVSGSTSTAVGTSGTNNPTATADTEAHGAGTIGATDQNGGTVGAGATAGVTAESPSGAVGDQNRQNTGRDRPSTGEPSDPNTGASTSARGGVSYQLMGVRNPNQYMNKRVEVVGTTSNAGNAGNQMLRVTSVKVLGDTCQ